MDVSPPPIPNLQRSMKNLNEKIVSGLLKNIITFVAELLGPMSRASHGLYLLLFLTALHDIKERNAEMQAPRVCKDFPVETYLRCPETLNSA